MTALEAMNEVNGFLGEGNVAGAQAAVVAIESEQSVLPSSVFERVLREAVAENALLPFYREFCQRAYGRDNFIRLMWSTFDSANGLAVRRMRPSRLT